ncbi:hypothetical protein Hanom_Chr14g01247721 [Helianthus anomalus]
MLTVRSLKPLTRQHSLFPFNKTLIKPPKRVFTAVLNSKNSPKRLPSSFHLFLIHSRILISTMALIIKNPHNYLCTFEKTDKNTEFHSIIDTLSSSKYKPLLICNAPIYQDALRDFWANAEVQVQVKKPWAISSKVGGVLVPITPQTISEVFQMNDLTGKTSFPKSSYPLDLTKRGYEGQLTKASMKKGEFPPHMKILFHTLLTCVSNKTTAFNEIPLKIQYLGYAIMTKTNFNYSQALFTDLVNNVKNVKEKKPTTFMFFPRFLSYYLQKKITKQTFKQGTSFKINSLSSETFTRLTAKDSKVSKTQAKESEQILDESISAP